jgi:hypothetical protein
MKFSAIKPVSRVLARELAVTALLLFGVSVVVFAILYLAPGDPLNVLLEGQSPRSELALGMREALGVPRTWYGQYAAWLWRGNFGNSIRTGLRSCPNHARRRQHAISRWARSRSRSSSRCRSRCAAARRHPPATPRRR